MSYPVYTVYSGDVLPIFFDSFDGGTGASITLTGLAVTDIEIYKDGSTTRRASDAGYTLLDTDGIDFDSITGIHGFSIDTGDNTDAGFYAVGSWYHVVVSSVTIDGQTVSFIAAAFRIVAAEAVAGVPVVDVEAILGSALSETSAGYLAAGFKKLLDVASPVFTLASINQTGDSYARLGSPAGASIAEDLVAIDNFVDDIESRLTATRAGYLDILADLADSGRLDLLIDSILADTNELQTDLVNGGRLDLLIDAINAKTSLLTFVNGHHVESEVQDKTGFSLSTAGILDIWHQAESAIVTASTIGLRIKTNLDAAMTTRSSHAAADVWAVGTRSLTTFGTLIADIWASATRSLTDKAGFSLHADYDAAKSAAPAGAKMDIVDAPSTAGKNALADAFLTRDFSSVSYTGTVKCILTSMQKLRNTVQAVTGKLKIYKENGTDLSWEQNITEDSDANPVTKLES